MALENYTPFKPPFPLDFDRWSPEQAADYFHWFQEQIPVRLVELRRALDANGGVDVPLEYDPASLPSLGAWFGSHVTTRPKSPAEIAELRRKPQWLRDSVKEWELSEETLSLCMDVGIYWAETLRRRQPELRWDFVRLSPDDADLHQPVLRAARGIDRLNPFRILDVLAAKVVEGESAEAELPRLFRVWEYALTLEPTTPAFVVPAATAAGTGPGRGSGALRAESLLLYYGARLSVSEEETRSLEAGTYPGQMAAEKQGLDATWGNFSPVGDREYYLFIGRKLGVLGPEHGEEVNLGDRDLLEMMEDIKGKLAAAGIDAPPALWAQWEPVFRFNRASGRRGAGASPSAPEPPEE